MSIVPVFAKDLENPIVLTKGIDIVSDCFTKYVLWILIRSSYEYPQHTVDSRYLELAYLE